MNIICVHLEKLTFCCWRFERVPFSPGSPRVSLVAEYSKKIPRILNNIDESLVWVPLPQMTPKIHPLTNPPLKAPSKAHRDFNLQGFLLWL